VFILWYGCSLNAASTVTMEGEAPFCGKIFVTPTWRRGGHRYVMFFTRIKYKKTTSMTLNGFLPAWLPLRPDRSVSPLPPPSSASLLFAVVRGH
jgi:hypothetical protein